jgi:phosphosulfolactate phosphohydrolase-like enzyme
LNTAVVYSQNARRLMSNPELRDDVPLCLQRDTVNFIAELKDGQIRKANLP